MKELLLQLLQRLQAIGTRNGEIYDTECRDAMAAAVFSTFLLPEAEYQFPKEFGLCTADANQAVRGALLEYVTAARELAPVARLCTFQQRLAALQDVSVITTDGGTYDEFFGSYAACLYGEDGEWLGEEPSPNIDQSCRQRPERPSHSQPSEPGWWE
ncbi:hypothetical protein FTUN_6186 [Frigoriglobus tundricola]|uniref:Uncharacterized protein n=1 Tax=Frigoriglobus tundricola TaxID=2774151 RepID=A0A6M5YZD7_9BACT|nr:hypothetical protein FTUN_6186 [Frigoriglobus tundricola]